MTGFVSKLRTLTLGSVHDLLDKAIDINSPSFLRQYVRDLEDALDHMRNQAAIQDGNVRRSIRERDQTQTGIEAKTKDTEKSLIQNRQDLARIQAAEVVRLKKTLDVLNADLKTQQVNLEAIDKSVSLLEEKHSQMVARLRELENLDRDSKNKEAAARAMEGAGKLIAGGADISVDDVESKMRARNDVASAQYDRAMGDLNTHTVMDDSETNQAVDDLLETLKKQPKEPSVA